VRRVAVPVKVSKFVYHVTRIGKLVLPLFVKTSADPDNAKFGMLVEFVESGWI
jgi:hypothetical protein